jgi:hypothetical protein
MPGHEPENISIDIEGTQVNHKGRGARTSPAQRDLIVMKFAPQVIAAAIGNLFTRI